MSERLPVVASEEQSYDAAARAFHGQATGIEELSDGVQAFVGLTSAVMSLPHKLILVDEPEAFLHPPLARRLGSNLTKLSAERQASLIVATHSSEFLMGCLETGNTNVVRLTYERNVATARALPADEIARLVRRPLLRSTGVLRGLFHRGVVATEADADRAFYDEVNARLVADGRGSPETLFINGQGKATLHELVGPMRRIGIPAAAIVDLDFIVRPREFERLLQACLIPLPDIARLEIARDAVMAAFRTVSRSSPKELGISVLPPAELASAERLLSELQSYGIFLVSVGELEKWQQPLGVGGHGPDWLVTVLERMGHVTDDPRYVRPEPGDVWDFIDSIEAWISNPQRLGIA